MFTDYVSRFTADVTGAISGFAKVQSSAGSVVTKIDSVDGAFEALTARAKTLAAQLKDGLVASGNKLTPQLAKIKDELGQVDGQIKAINATAGESDGKVGGFLDSFASKISIVAAAAGVMAGVFGAAQKNLELQNLAATARTSEVGIRQLTQAGQQFGIQGDTMAGVIDKVGRNLLDAQKGSAEARSAFAILGVSWSNGAGKARDTTEAVLAQIKALGKIKNDAVALQLGEKLGFNAKTISDIRANGGAAAESFAKQFAAQRQLAEANTKNAESSAKFQLELNKLKSAGLTFFTAIGSVFLPILNPLIGLLSQLAAPVAYFADALTSILKPLAASQEAMIALGAGIAAALLPSIIGMAVSFAASIPPAIAAGVAWIAAFFPIIAIGAVVAAVVYGIIVLFKNWKSVVEAILSPIDAAKKAIGGIASFFGLGKTEVSATQTTVSKTAGAAAPLADTTRRIQANADSGQRANNITSASSVLNSQSSSQSTSVGQVVINTQSNASPNDISTAVQQGIRDSANRSTAVGATAFRN